MRTSRLHENEALRLLDKRLLVIMGKGGVGKSTISALLALRAAREGKKVLCCEVNTKERVAPLLGARPSGPDIQEAVPGVFTVNVRPKEAMREYALMKLRFQAVYNVVFENRLVRHFVRLVPSLAETVILGKVWYEVESKIGDRHKWDLVILDAPATGHGVSLLRIPRVLMETVPPGPMREEAEKMEATLTDPSKTRIDLVTLPEEMPVSETVDLEKTVRTELEMPLGYLFLNTFVERRFDESEVGDLLGVADRTFSTCGNTKQGSASGTLHPAVAAAQAALHHASRAELSAYYESKLEAQLPNIRRLKLPRIHSSKWGRGQILLLDEALTSLLAEETRPRAETKWAAVP